MPGTVFTVRQFTNIPSENLPLGPRPANTFIVSGSESNMLINDTRTNLSEDDLYGQNNGWFPGPSTAADAYGIIVGGNDGFQNTAADNRAGGAKVSCYGWVAQETQGTNDTEFINLAQYVCGTTFVDVSAAKSFLDGLGYYYQYPVGFNGQSPNTGNGSD